jgi:hypothetical protein
MVPSKSLAPVPLLFGSGDKEVETDNARIYFYTFYPRKTYKNLLEDHNIMSMAMARVNPSDELEINCIVYCT